MSTKKHALRFCNGQKRTPLLDLRKCIKTRSFLSFPVLLCSRHGRRNCSKSSKIHHKMITKMRLRELDVDFFGCHLNEKFSFRPTKFGLGFNTKRWPGLDFCAVKND